MNDHLLRKHGIDTEHRPSKRNNSEFPDEEPTTKRHCPSVEQKRAGNGGITPEPQTPQTQLTDNAFQRTNGLTARSQTQSGALNLVHIDDDELNKFMQMGRIRVQNGLLYMVAAERDIEY